MFNRILVAIDGSSYWQEALPATVEIAKRFDGEVLVLHASEHDRGRAVVYSLETPAAATAMVAGAVKKLQDVGLTAKGQLVDVAAGHVAKAIVETAKANGSDLIVMGSRGLSDVQGILLGSVTHKVIQAAAIPVLVIRTSTAKPATLNGAVASFTP
jgi:nucleotide-binding universal stress UspA family protein